MDSAFINPAFPPILYPGGIPLEFTSVFFLEAFLPALLAVYLLLGLIRKKNVCLALRNGLLLLASLVFYAWGGIKDLLLFLALIAVNYLFGRGIDALQKKQEHNQAKTLMAVGVVLNALALCVFKYTTMTLSLIEAFKKGDGFWSTLVHFTGNVEGVKGLLMPLAFSFIVFQAISYVVDVYKGKVNADENPLRFALYMTLFVQLSQGPIERYGSLGAQIADREHSADKMLKGIRRFCVGLAKKILIANVVAVKADAIFGTEDISSLSSGIAWFGILCYTLQIYYDFSGYTDMAIGLGMLFGFDISENFDYPYTSLSVQEFWRRWHISLSNWFKDYIYIPLGGSRCSKGRIFFNLSVVFFVTGIWHGANLTFLLWGLLFAVFSVLERAFLGDLLRKNPVKFVNWIYTTFVVMMGWVLFRAPSLAVAGQYYAKLFSFSASPSGKSLLSYVGAEVLLAVIAGILFSGLLQRPLSGLRKKFENNTVCETVSTVVCIALLAFSLIQVVGGSYNPSIYGNF